MIALRTVAIIALTALAPIAAPAQAEPSTGETSTAILPYVGDIWLNVDRANGKFAERDYLMASQLYNNLPEAAFNSKLRVMAALANAGADDLVKSREHLRIALRLNPAYVDAQLLLAVVSKRLGDTATATRLREKIEQRLSTCNGTCKDNTSLTRAADYLRRTI